MTITDHEAAEIERANASGRTPVVFIHGLWLLASSWDDWAEAFGAAGYAPVKAGWPDDPGSIEAARANPGAFAGKKVGQVADHYSEVIGRLTGEPVVVGHSFGGLLTQIVAARGLAKASVAICPAQFRGILQLPLAALRTTRPVFQNPLNRGRAVTLSYDQFRYGWANAVDEQEARELYERFHVAAPGAPIFQAATANLDPWTDCKVDTRASGRGPLLIVSGEKDHAVPVAVCKAAYAKQKRNADVTEFELMPNRGHSLTIDSGHREVCEKALGFVERFA